MEKRLQIIFVFLIGAALLIVVVPYALTPADKYVRLGTLSTNGFYRFFSQEEGALVNVIFEPKIPINELNIDGTLVLAINNLQQTQDLRFSELVLGAQRTNWFYLRPMFSDLPKNEAVNLSVQVATNFSIPVDLILRYRTYRFPKK